MSARLDELVLSTRANNLCAYYGIVTLEGLSKYTRSQLLHTKNAGRKTVQELEVLLAKHGLRLSKFCHICGRSCNCEAY